MVLFPFFYEYKVKSACVPILKVFLSRIVEKEFDSQLDNS